MTLGQWSQCQRALAHHAANEARSQWRQHSKTRMPSTFRYFPPQWHRDAVEALGSDDYEGVFAYIMYPSL